MGLTAHARRPPTHRAIPAARYPLDRATKSGALRPQVCAAPRLLSRSARRASGRHRQLPHHQPGRRLQHSRPHYPQGGGQSPLAVGPDIFPWHRQILT